MWPILVGSVVWLMCGVGWTFGGEYLFCIQLHNILAQPCCVALLPVCPHVIPI